MAAPPVRILSRYLVRQHAAPLAYALGALTALLLLNQVAKQFGNLVGKGLPWDVIAEVFVLSVPFIIAMTLPMAVLVAVLHAMTRLATDHEITAMKAGGVSVGRIFKPILGGACVMALVAFAWNDQVLPRSNYHLRLLLWDIQRKKPSFSLREQVINEVVPGQFFLRAGRIDQATNRLRDVTIYDLADPDRRRIISADSGTMAYTPGGTDLYFTLRDGDIREIRRGETRQFNRTFFRVNRIRVAGVSNELQRTSSTGDDRSSRETTMCQMAREVRLAHSDLARAPAQARAEVRSDLRRIAGLALPPRTAQPPPDAAPADTAAGWYCGFWAHVRALLSPREARAQEPVRPRQVPDGRRPRPPRLPKSGSPRVLTPRPRAAPRAPAAPGQATPVPPHFPTVVLSPGAGLSLDQRERGVRLRIADFAVEMQKKLAISAACIAFALLGFPLAMRFPRGGAGLVIGVSVAVFAVYYVGLIGGEDLGKRLIVSPFVAMWVPNLIFLAVGLVGLWSVRHEGGLARGGGWGDLAVLRRWRSRRPARTAP